MTIRTSLCDLLGIQHPIMLAGMGGVSYAEVCAAVSEAGGFGTLGMAGRSTEEIRTQMRKVRQLTKKPFGVDLLAAVPESLEKTADIIIEEGASAFISGLGVPPRHLVDRFHAAGLKVMNVCGTVRHAKAGEDGGLDAVVAQGTEAGGHTGKIAGLALIPQIVDAVKVPVVAAGSIVDGRGLAAALALGAQGVWVGTRFIASTEAHAGDMYKQVVVDATDEDTIITRAYSGKPMRVFKNDYVADWERRPQRHQTLPDAGDDLRPEQRHGRHRRPNRRPRARKVGLRDGPRRGLDPRNPALRRNHQAHDGGRGKDHRPDGTPTSARVIQSSYSIA